MIIKLISRLVIGSAIILTLIECTGKESSSDSSSMQEEKKRKLEQFFIKVDEANNKGDKSAYVNLFTPDATMFLPNRPPLIGRDAISDWSEKFHNKVTLITDTYEQENIDIVGDIAIVRSRGTGFYVINATQERIPIRNIFIDVLKYSDGEWLFMYHFASSFSFEPGLWNRDWENQQEDTTQD
jgi:uncharacterized protein (TIGR02246 family)